MTGVLGLLVVIVAGFGVAAVARAARGAPAVHPPVTPPVGGAPPPSGLATGLVSAFASQGLVPADSPGGSTHALTPLEASQSPILFALAAGYSSVEAMVDQNPHLRLIDAPPESWPPQVRFSYIVKGTTAFYGFSPTGKIDEDYGPTFKSGDNEWVFPTWAEAVGRPDIKTDHPVYEGNAPILTTKGVPIVYGSPLATPPYVVQRALIPWVAGTVINLPQAVA